MKNIHCLILTGVVLVVLPVQAQDKYPSKITLRVVDDRGAPVTQGEARLSTFSRWQAGQGFGRDVDETLALPLRSDGRAVFEVPNMRGEVAYGVIPAGRYYPVRGLTYRFQNLGNRRWEPWNPEVTVEVPRVLDPIALYTRRIDALELPSRGPVGFDLMASDWVQPYGNGKVADLVFTVTTVVPMTDPAKGFESYLSITFTNPGDGIQARTSPPRRRLLDLPRHAPEGGYEPKVIKRVARSSEGAALETDTRADQNYFFRVRTELDSQGKVVKALHGKILGDISWDILNSVNGHLQLTYYLNPDPLNRNLEFDPNRNLFPANLVGTNVSEP